MDGKKKRRSGSGNEEMFWLEILHSNEERKRRKDVRDDKRGAAFSFPPPRIALSAFPSRRLKLFLEKLSPESVDVPWAEARPAVICYSLKPNIRRLAKTFELCCFDLFKSWNASIQPHKVGGAFLFTNKNLKSGDAAGVK